MKDVSANFFDDFYLQVCTACEDKLLELEWKLEVEKKGEQPGCSAHLQAKSL